MHFIAARFWDDISFLKHKVLLSLAYSVGLRALIDEGKDLAERLTAVDASQELKRLKEVSEKVREF
jgi:hypothetical protein